MNFQFFKRLPRKYRILSAIPISFVLLGVLYLTRSNWLPLLFDYLNVGQPPAQSDYLVALGGGESRVRKAVDLYRAGFATTIVVSGCECALNADVLNKADIPGSAIVFNNQDTNTWDEAEQVLKILKSKGAHSALIVTDPPHMRRAYATYRTLNKSGSIELTFTISDYPWSRDNWWKSATSREAVLSEYVKLAFYLLHYGVVFW